jgi:hypothetical protein
MKLKFKPTPIGRLLKYKEPLKMVGDPHWWAETDHCDLSYKEIWEHRCIVVYTAMIEEKRSRLARTDLVNQQELEYLAALKVQEVYGT